MDKKELIELRRNAYYREDKDKYYNMLVEVYEKEYKPTHSLDEYKDLVYNNTVNIRKLNDGGNYPEYVISGWCEASQHIQGFTKEHLYDQMIEDIEARRLRDIETAKLPELDDLVFSNDIEIDEDATYRTKEPYGWAEHSGKAILKMREQGWSGYSVIDGMSKAEIDRLVQIFNKNRGYE